VTSRSVVITGGNTGLGYACAAALLTSQDGARELASNPAARDFVSDAYAHYKFVGYTGDAAPLLEAAGVAGRLDGGFVELTSNGKDADGFLSTCAQLRFWDRENAS